MRKPKNTRILVLLFVLMLVPLLSTADQKKTTNPPPAKPAPAAKPAAKQAQPAAKPAATQAKPAAKPAHSPTTQPTHAQPANAGTKQPSGQPSSSHPVGFSPNSNDRRGSGGKGVGGVSVGGGGKGVGGAIGTAAGGRPAGGRITSSVPLKGGGTAQVTRRADGRVADIHANGMSIHQNARGGRTIVGEHNGRTVVNTGRQGGYVQRPYIARNGRNYYQRTYVMGGRSYARVYRGYDYHGVRYYGYVPGYYYHPAFYGWAYNPWVSPVYFGPAAWGWVGAPWFGVYGGFFTPYPVYSSASLWLTDYLVAANLQAAFQAQAEANGGASDQPAESGLAFLPVYVPGTKTLAQGFTTTGGIGFAGDRLILNSGATAAFSISVPPGQVQTVAYGIPTGSYVNNAPAEVAVDGVTVAMINQGRGGIGVTTPTQMLLWQKSFGPGDYTITVRSAGSVNFYGLWLGQPAPPEAGASAATPLGPEVKQAIADEVQRQLAAEKDAAANPGGPSPAPAGGEVPDALNPAERVFVVASNLDVTNTANGQECALTAGDVVMRLTDSPDPNRNVNASIQSSKQGDCATGQTVAVGVQDLQEMHNQFRAQLDSGLQQLAADGGKGNLPKAPDTATTAGEVPPPTPDSGAAAQLTAQQQQADQTQAQLVN